MLFFTWKMTMPLVLTSSLSDFTRFFGDTIKDDVLAFFEEFYMRGNCPKTRELHLLF